MRIPNIQNNQRYLCVYMYILLGKPQIIGKFIGLGLFLLQDMAGCTVIGEYAEYSLDSEPDLVQTSTRKGIPQILRLIAQK